MDRRHRIVPPPPGEARAVSAPHASAGRFFSRFHTRVADRAARDTVALPRAPDFTSNSTSSPSKDLAGTAK